MKKHFGKTFLLMMLSATLLSNGLSANASSAEVWTESSQIELRVVGLADYSCDLNINSSGKAGCYCKVEVKQEYDSEFTLTLQRSANGRTWDDVISWSGNGSGSLSKIQYVTPGYAYQLRLTIKVYNDAGKYVATYGKNSNVVSY